MFFIFITAIIAHFLEILSPSFPLFSQSRFFIILPLLLSSSPILRKNFLFPFCFLGGILWDLQLINISSFDPKNIFSFFGRSIFLYFIFISFLKFFSQRLSFIKWLLFLSLSFYLFLFIDNSLLLLDWNLVNSFHNTFIEFLSNAPLLLIFAFFFEKNRKITYD